MSTRQEMLDQIRQQELEQIQQRPKRQQPIISNEATRQFMNDVLIYAGDITDMLSGRRATAEHANLAAKITARDIAGLADKSREVIDQIDMTDELWDLLAQKARNVADITPPEDD